MVNQVGGKAIKMEDKKHPINRIIRTEQKFTLNIIL